ncbi:MAG: DUF5011 domain-containing protein, partial [Bacilli bacterium]|nr:DUF5011 domain-containing protein [Bacilli bacterium]
KKIKTVVVCIIVALAIWFVIVSPYIKFKKNEKIVMEAGKRYYEINTGQLPTGEKIKTVGLQKLYEKDFISDDLRSAYMKQACDSKTSWVKVRKEKGEYQYYVYLKCGIFSSRVDHKGPEIKLKGEEEITINKGEKYQDPGVESVVDNQDGKMDIKDVEINKSGLDTNKVGVYEIHYKIKDSFNNETEKVRVVKVVETLNHIIEKDTKKRKIYQGSQTDNYVKIDGIVFQIVGENEDGSVKLVTHENISAVDYKGVENYLNEYFYEKLSESAKKLIVKSKYCDEDIKNPEEYSKCGHYSNKKNVGLLSVLDINNSKGEDGSYNINSVHSTMLENKQSSKVIALNASKYIKYSKSENIGIRPTINIKKESDVVGGDGTIGDPYIIKENKKKLKVGEKVSEARVGEYINYSGYTFRVIGKEKDGTTKVIMDGVLQNSVLPFDENGEASAYNIDKKSNIGYKINSDLSKYISSKYFVKKSVNRNIYNDGVQYQIKPTDDKYQTKLSLPSIYDLFSASNSVDSWFINYSKKDKENYQYLQVLGVVHENKDTVSEAGVRLIGYLDSDMKIKKGNGTLDNSYTIVK